MNNKEVSNFQEVSVGTGTYVAVVQHDDKHYLGSGDSGIQAIVDAHPEATTADLYYVNDEYFARVSVHTESGTLAFGYKLEHFGISQPSDAVREKAIKEAYLGKVNIPQRVDT